MFCSRHQIGALALVAVGMAGGFGVGRIVADAPAAVSTRAAPNETAPGLAASALSVIDGDTLEARVSVFPGQDIVTRVRLVGVDAPERRGRCAGERDAAEQATRALGAMVEGRRLTLTEIRGDKYFGRVVARVATESGDLADALVAGGYGRPYGGGRRKGWC